MKNKFDSGEKWKFLCPHCLTASSRLNKSVEALSSASVERRPRSVKFCYRIGATECLRSLPCHCVTSSSISNGIGMCLSVCLSLFKCAHFNCMFYSEKMRNSWMFTSLRFQSKVFFPAAMCWKWRKLCAFECVRWAHGDRLLFLFCTFVCCFFFYENERKNKRQASQSCMTCAWHTHHLTDAQIVSTWTTVDNHFHFTMVQKSPQASDDIFCVPSLITAQKAIWRVKPLLRPSTFSRCRKGDFIFLCIFAYNEKRRMKARAGDCRTRRSQEILLDVENFECRRRRKRCEWGHASFCLFMH